ncbi:MAG: hypothetical protein SNJ29_10455 [Rikenellaceae bacterium]
MDWQSLGQTTLTVLCSTSAIAYILKKVFESILTNLGDKLTKSYQLDIDKKLAEHQLNLNKNFSEYKLTLDKLLAEANSNYENKNYVSKVRFDKEFKIYEELSDAFFELVSSVNQLIPTGLSKILPDKVMQKEREDSYYQNTIGKRNIAASLLQKNSVFIDIEFYNLFNEIIKLSDKQIDIFSQRYNLSYIASQETKETIDLEDYNRTTTINETINRLNNQLRAYLKSLEVKQ